MAWCRKNIKIHYTSRTLNFETGAMSSFGKLHPSSSQGCFFFHGSMVKFAKSSHLCRENALENGSNKPNPKNHLERLFSDFPGTSSLGTLIRIFCGRWRSRWKFRTCDDQLMIIQGVIDRAISPQDQ